MPVPAWPLCLQTQTLPPGSRLGSRWPQRPGASRDLQGPHATSAPSQGAGPDPKGLCAMGWLWGVAGEAGSEGTASPSPNAQGPSSAAHGQAGGKPTWLSVPNKQCLPLGLCPSCWPPALTSLAAKPLLPTRPFQSLRRPWLSLPELHNNLYSNLRPGLLLTPPSAPAPGALRAVPWAWTALPCIPGLCGLVVRSQASGHLLSVSSPRPRLSHCGDAVGGLAR